MAASTEQRYQLGAYAADRNEPGLIRESDGTVWLVNPDTTRTQVSGGGGGGLPAWWTVDSGAGSKRLTLNGNLIVLGEEGVSDATKFFDAGDFDGDTELTISKDDGLIFWSGGDIVTQIARGGDTEINGGLIVTPPLVAGAAGRDIAFYAAQAEAGFSGGTVTIDGGNGDGGNGTGAGGEVHGGGDDGSGGNIDFTAGHGGSGAQGGDVGFHAGRGDGHGGAGPGSLTLAGNLTTGAGGDTSIYAGYGNVDRAGGILTLSGGSGNAGGSPAAGLDLGGGDDVATPGRISIFTGGSNGSAGQVLTAQGDGTAIWVTP